MVKTVAAAVVVKNATMAVPVLAANNTLKVYYSIYISYSTTLRTRDVFQCRPKPSQTRYSQSLVHSLRENCQDHPRRGSSYGDDCEGHSYDQQGEGGGKLLQCKKIIRADARSRNEVDPTHVSAACSTLEIPPRLQSHSTSLKCLSNIDRLYHQFSGNQQSGALYLIVSWVTSVAVL